MRTDEAHIPMSLSGPLAPSMGQRAPWLALGVRTEEESAVQAEAHSEQTHAAFSQFLEARQDQILGVAYRLLRHRDDAFDVLQEVACILYKRWDSLDASNNIDGWLYRVTVNECHRWLRQRARQPRPEGEAEQLAAAQAHKPGQEARVSALQFQAFLADALALLSEQERVAFLLRDIEQRPGKQLAALMGCQPATARGYYFNARKKLAAHIQQHAPEWLTLLGKGGAS